MRAPSKDFSYRAPCDRDSCVSLVVYFMVAVGDCNLTKRTHVFFCANKTAVLLRLWSEGLEKLSLP